MSALAVCQECRGFVPPGATTCVHCGAAMPEPLARGGMGGVAMLMGLASAGVAAITLMACYGMPPCGPPAPDGGSDPYYCYDFPPANCTSPAATDGGTDGGMTDGGITDGGMDPLCGDVLSPSEDAGVPSSTDAGH